MLDEFETLIDPEGSVGPTSVHGITEAMVAGAPTFAEVAAALTDHLDGSVLVAHNLKFDRRMLDQEYERFTPRDDLDWGAGICTLRLSGMKLAVACETHGIPLLGHHRALDDARATAELLRRVVDRDAETSPMALRLPAGLPSSTPRTRLHADA